MKRLKYFLVIFVSVLCIKPAVSSDLRVDDFSWYFGPNGIVIDSAAASTDYPQRRMCLIGTECGLSIQLMVKKDDGTDYNPYYIQVYDTVRNFTNARGVLEIKKLVGKTIQNTASLNRPGYQVQACVWKYERGNGLSGNTELGGVCSVGYIPPIPVPANCDLSIDNSVMDFGDISSTAFLNAGAGGKPSGTSVQQRTLNVSCSSPQSALAKLRVTTNKASGNMLVSSNQDVGFLLSAGESDPTVKPLTPNQSSSSYTVKLDNQGKASVAIKAVPVSVTGEKPIAGSFTSNALLHISWD